MSNSSRSPSEIHDLLRAEEMKAALDVLESRRSAVIAITGRTGSGRQGFIRELANRAQSRGWRVVPSASEDALHVNDTVTISGFRRRLMQNLMPGCSGTTVVPPDSADLVEVLRRSAPLMVVIEEFGPTDSFCEWLRRDVGATLKNVPEPIVIVIGDRGLPESSALTCADEHISLGPLDPARIELILRGAGASVTPPLGDSELRVYANAIAGEPELMSGLLRVLAICTTPAEGASGEPL